MENKYKTVSACLSAARVSLIQAKTATSRLSWTAQSINLDQQKLTLHMEIEVYLREDVRRYKQWIEGEERMGGKMKMREEGIMREERRMRGEGRMRREDQGGEGKAEEGEGGGAENEERGETEET